MYLSEDKIQQDIFMWFNNNYCLKHHDPRCIIFSVPNGGTRNKMEAMKLKSTGMKAGVSDLIVILPNKVLFVEVKTETGRQSDKQIEFEKTITDLGYSYILVRSLGEFKTVVSEFLN